MLLTRLGSQFTPDGPLKPFIIQVVSGRAPLHDRPRQPEKWGQHRQKNLTRAQKGCDSPFMVPVCLFPGFVFLVPNNNTAYFILRVGPSESSAGLITT